MWGFFNSRDRILANKIFGLLINPLIAPNYNLNHSSPKGFDQYFLSSYVYLDIKKSSIIHDSYTCQSFKDSQPFPTKRHGNCFVGTSLDICDDKEPSFVSCPIQCRPKDHSDWTYC